MCKFRYVTFGTRDFLKRKVFLAVGFITKKTLLFVLSYTFFRAMQPIIMVKISTLLCFRYLLKYFSFIQL